MNIKGKLTGEIRMLPLLGLTITDDCPGCHARDVESYDRALPFQALNGEADIAFHCKACGQVWEQRVRVSMDLSF